MWAYAVLPHLGEQPVRTQAASAEAIGADKTRIIGVLAARCASSARTFDQVRHHPRRPWRRPCQSRDRTVSARPARLGT